MFSRYKITAIFILFTLLLSSCYNLRNTAYLQEQRISLPEYEKGAFVDYRLRVNDEIVFRVTTIDPEISAIYSAGGGVNVNNMISYRIESDGTVDLPFIPKIHLEGLTLKEATEVVEKRFREVVSDATVRMALRNRNFTVIGDVGTGVFPVYRERLTIYQALALAGDLHQSGDRKHIKILRETDDGIITLEFDIRPRSVIESEFYYIYPNDIIYVRKLPASFYKVGSYTGLLTLINSTVTFFNTILIYTQIRN